MAITDLTGYTWIGNDTIDISSEWNYFLNYNIGGPGGLLGSNIQSAYFVDGYYLMIYIDGSIHWVYNNTSKWIEPDARTLYFTGGTDVSNTSLISWLQSNGQLIAPPVIKPVSIIYNSTEIFSGEFELPVNISYKGSIIASLGESEEITAKTSALVKCANKFMQSNLLVGNKILKCKGKTMSDDVLIQFAQSPWEPPVQEGSTLRLTQAFITQNNDTLILE